MQGKDFVCMRSWVPTIHYLEINQKYSFVVVSSESTDFSIEVQFSENKAWNQIFYKKITAAPFRGRADKIATTSNMYMFCLNNLSRKVVEFGFQLDSGLEVMELNELATDSDSETI